MLIQRPTQSYGEIIRRKMTTADNPRKHPLTLREVATMTGRSYEHVRKTVLGEPVGSYDFNERLCNALGLNAQEMWSIAQWEKAKRKYGNASPLARVALPENQDFAVLWEQLSEESRAQVVKLMEALSMKDRLASELADRVVGINGDASQGGEKKRQAKRTKK